MSLFSEEQLDSPSGFFPAYPGQTLNHGRWKVLRKLGWGPRSSAWLVDDTKSSDNIEVVKIFTVASTEDTTANKELSVYKALGANHFELPVLRENFIEKSEKGHHLCLVFHALSGVSIEQFRQSGALPLHIVKQVVSKILDSLVELHETNVMHGAVTLDNFLFETVQEADDIRASELPAKVVKVTANDGVVYSTVKSQPLPVDVTSSSSRQNFANVSLKLANLSHAKFLKQDKSVDTSISAFFAPEVLQGEEPYAKSDVWLLGCSVYLMLTGVPLFSESSVAHYTEVLSTLEDRLKVTHKVAESDISASVEFLRSCLDMSPATRSSSSELLDLKWVMEGDVCSCGYCVT
ncbi:kinase-like domain-containing protein [Crepidotus variabilis]|uniref:non-specific serine/threonine protein kinase n=1 Tax=Crepidotus variabilis TaxID=179855 RepID=A0A9P6EEK7_9AGAR|nr:kinase-like domain-containing protein [Crepidotus variabilis]